jgi:hypothetical protein
LNTLDQETRNKIAENKSVILPHADSILDNGYEIIDSATSLLSERRYEECYNELLKYKGKSVKMYAIDLNSKM